MKLIKPIFCCDEMKFHVESDELELRYSPVFRMFSLRNRTDNSSQIIKFCPWCGAKLPKDLGNEWFERIEAMGFDEPNDSRIPEEFRSDAWWKADPELNNQEG